MWGMVGVCRPQSVGKLDEFADRMTIIPGATDDREVIEKAVAGCDGVLTVLAPWGVQAYASGTAQAVLDFAAPDARLIYSCGWHISLDGKDVYSLKLRLIVAVLTPVAIPGRSSLFAASLPQESRTFAASATVEKNGAHTSARPISS